MLSCAHTYPPTMFSKSNNTQTLWVGLSFLAVGLIAGMFISNGGVLMQTAQQTESEDPAQVDPAKLQTVSVSEDDDPSLGEDSAPITIIEFSDFQCSWCNYFYLNTLPELLSNYVDQGVVRIVYRDFLSSKHPQSSLAAQAAECTRAKTTTADRDSVYFDMHDLLFETQSSWSGAPDAKEQMVDLAASLNVDIQTCLDTEEMKAEAEADYVAGKSYGISGTPTFFINGKKLVGAHSYEVFEKIIESLR